MNSVLESTDSVTSRRLFPVIKYDYRARPARVETENPMGGHDVENMEHDFLGRVTKRHVLHHGLRNDIDEEYAYAYDHAGRLLKVEHRRPCHGLWLQLALVADEGDESGFRGGVALQ